MTFRLPDSEGARTREEELSQPFMNLSGPARAMFVASSSISRAESASFEAAPVPLDFHSLAKAFNGHGRTPSAPGAAAP